MLRNPAASNGSAGLSDVTERVSGGDLPNMDFGKFLDETFGFIRKRWRYFHALLVDQPDARFVARWKEAVKANFARRHLVAGDAFDLSWADGIDTGLPTLVIVSGVFQYFRNADVLGFIADAKEAFADAELVFDATNTKGLEFANRYVRKTGNESALMHCAIDDPAAFVREAGCELVEVRPFYTAARHILKGRANLYTRVAMAVTDRTGRAFILHVKL